MKFIRYSNQLRKINKIMKILCIAVTMNRRLNNKKKGVLKVKGIERIVIIIIILKIKVLLKLC